MNDWRSSKSVNSLGVTHGPSFFRNAQELKQTFSYISSIKGDKDDKTPLFIHVSVHGDDSGIGGGPDIIGWDNLAKTVQQMYARLRYDHGPIILVLSACGVNKQ
jgi:glycosylphosphatidylinositol transamidase (GPIT) subunit GPI8